MTHLLKRIYDILDEVEEIELGNEELAVKHWIEHIGNFQSRQKYGRMK